jgi:hypothetical protein
MSADNGIYIGIFPTAGGKEYRVIEAQAIDNCSFDDSLHDPIPGEVTEWYRVIYYRNAEVFTNKTEALIYAEKLANEQEILEYGISGIEYDRPLLPLHADEAEAKLNKYWADRAKVQRVKQKEEDKARKIVWEKKEAEKKELREILAEMREAFDPEACSNSERYYKFLDWAEQFLK